MARRSIAAAAATSVMACACLFFAASLSAGENSEGLAQFIARLQQHYESTNSFSADFDQTLTSAGGPPRRRSGKIFYQKPGRLRWQFSPPQSETIVSDGTTLYDYDPGLNQVVETPLRDAVKERSAAPFILGVGNLERDFNVQRLQPPGSDGLEHLAATPKDGGQRLDFDVDRKSLDLVSLRISDPLGNTDLIHLKAIRRNIPLDSALFRFNPPAGVDIVKAPPHA